MTNDDVNKQRPLKRLREELRHLWKSQRKTRWAQAVRVQFVAHFETVLRRRGYATLIRDDDCRLRHRLIWPDRFSRLTPQEAAEYQAYLGALAV